MLCYRDRTYCACRNCKKYASCEDSEHHAVVERNLHPDAFVRNLPLCVADFSDNCKEYELAKKVGE